MDAPSDAGRAPRLAEGIAPAPGTGVLRVALNVPLRTLFDYLPPAALPGGDIPDIQPGMRVRVPFGTAKKIGVVVELAAHSTVPAERLRAVTARVDSTPTLDAGLLGVLSWAAGYYHHPIGEVIWSGVPRELRLGAPLEVSHERWSATGAGREALAAGQMRRAPKRQRLLERLAAGAAAAATLDVELPGWRVNAGLLIKRGWIQREQVAGAALAADPTALPGPARRQAGPPLREEQQAAVTAIAASFGQFAAFVLHGVTGSGKTEVYLQLVERVLAAGGAALVLVPEIGLTPQLVGRFQARFATPIAVLHSALTLREHLKAWRDTHSGHARVVIGTRSAVLAPVQGLSLIIVDEEHDSSFKQQEEGFHYSARDVAVVRAQRAGVPVVLGSATPSLETLHNVSTGRYRRLVMQQRAGDASPPRLALLDLRHHETRQGLATPAAQAIERHLKEDGQVLVFLNRRGYAPTLLCIACGWMAPCSECDARLTVHQGAQRLRCHHCGADSELPARCPACGHPVKSLGQGTERIEETLTALFPNAPLARLDRDTVRKRGDIEEVVRRMASGEARILVGTQMVTKGHDFPRLTLVVVLNADQGLFSCDYKTPERIAQTLIQVAGRAGRGSAPGEVLIQTELPTHPLLQSLLHEGYDGFARLALAERRESSWPPFSRLAAVRASATEAPAALSFLEDARRLATPVKGLRVLGPVTAAMHRRAGRYHCQLLIESIDRGRLHQFLQQWLPGLSELKSAKAVRWALDVDPIELF